MFRVSVRLALGLGLLVASGCERGEPAAVTVEQDQQPAREAFPQPIELIPNEADAMLGLSPTLLGGSVLADKFAAELGSNPQFQEAQRSLRGCGLQLRSFEAVFMGRHEHEFVLVLVGSGLGEDAHAICMIEAAQRFVGAAPSAKISVEHGKKIMDFPDGRVFLVNPDLLVLTTAAWQQRVGALIDGEDGGEAQPAAKHGKRELLATLDTRAPAWLAADVPRQLVMAANFLGVPEAAAAATSLSGTLQLNDRAQLQLTAGFETAAEAQTAAAKLEALLAKPGPDVPAALVGVFGRIHAGHVGNRVRLGFEIQAGDVAALAAI